MHKPAAATIKIDLDFNKNDYLKINLKADFLK